MKLLRCDTCNITHEASRKYYGCEVKNFIKIEMEDNQYDFCSQKCKLEWLKKQSEVKA